MGPYVSSFFSQPLVPRGEVADRSDSNDVATMVSNPTSVVADQFIDMKKCVEQCEGKTNVLEAPVLIYCGWRLRIFAVWKGEKQAEWDFRSQRQLRQDDRERLKIQMGPDRFVPLREAIDPRPAPRHGMEVADNRFGRDFEQRRTKVLNRER